MDCFAFARNDGLEKSPICKSGLLIACFSLFGTFLCWAESPTYILDWLGFCPSPEPSAIRHTVSQGEREQLSSPFTLHPSRLTYPTFQTFNQLNPSPEFLNSLCSLRNSSLSRRGAREYFSHPSTLTLHVLNPSTLQPYSPFTPHLSRFT